jgi:hypothetical protein
MRKALFLWLSVFVIVLAGQYAVADDFIVYPSKGQSQKKMEEDKFQCYGWAKQQTGFDPMDTPKASTPPPPDAQGSVGGSAVKGAAKGAIVGAGIGAIAGDTGKGAAIGAVSGGALGGMRTRRQQEESQQAQKQWADQQSSQYMQKRDTYNRAYKACLTGRGYTVQ